MINIRKFLGLEYYTSSLDKFLQSFDLANLRKLSASQRMEIEKYTRIYALRDNPKPLASEENFWDKF